MSSKLSEILLTLTEAIEAIDPTVAEQYMFKQWQGTGTLATAAREATGFRAFRISPSMVSRGSRNSNSSQQSKQASFQLQVGYPEDFYQDNLNIENIIAEDDALIVSSVCFKRPLIIQTLENVSAVRYSQSFKSGSLWIVEFEIDYFEPNL